MRPAKMFANGSNHLPPNLAMYSLKRSAYLPEPKSAYASVVMPRIAGRT